MSDFKNLAEKLRHIHHKNYKLYKNICGSYTFPGFTLQIDHVQGDPFSDPSKVRLFMTPAEHQLPAFCWKTPQRQLATRDFLTRRFARSAETCSQQIGTGKGGLIAIDCPGQQVLDKTSCLIADDLHLELRFEIGLPAQGRRILGHDAARIICELLPRMVQESLLLDETARQSLKNHIETVEDTFALRAQLEGRGLVAFVGDGANLPRASGVSDLPLTLGAKPFSSPKLLRVTLERPNQGPIEGMGIPTGITLIVGGGYHGKSTLLKALQNGIYQHIPGDGRENIVSLDSAVKLRAEDGRSIKGVDISPFIDGLPQGQSTAPFSSENASGSTSQASSIIEAMASGARLLLMDEDSSASNFMIRDARMQRLIAPDKEPITPLIDRIRELYVQHQVSSILVMGASGDYFSVADTVVGMDEFCPSDLTQKALEICKQFPPDRQNEASQPFPKTLTPRQWTSKSLDPAFRGKEVYVKTWEGPRIQFGQTTIDLNAVEQLCHPSQIRSLAQALLWLRENRDCATLSLEAAVQHCRNYLTNHGLSTLSHRPDGALAEVRAIDIAATLNRYRGLKVQ